MTKPHNLSIWLAGLLLTSCQIPAPLKKLVKPLPPTITQPPSLHTATTVQIKNDWNGYSDITPIVRHYKFQRQSDGLVGNGYFAVGGYGAHNIRQQYTKKIQIPAPITQQFLQKLSETKMHSASRYQPLRNRSDDYPAVTIQVTNPRYQITFFSSSQGKNHTPWQIKIKESTYISNSAAPAVALAILKPYIDHPGLEQIINKHRSPPATKPPKAQPQNSKLPAAKISPRQSP